MLSRRLQTFLARGNVNKQMSRCVTNAVTATTQNDAELKPFSAMPGPRGLPLIGMLWHYMKPGGYRFNKMFLAMQDLQSKYGPVYFEKIGHISHVVVSDPHEYAKVIRVDGRTPRRIEMEPLAHYRRKNGLILGTVNGQGEEWYRHRTVLIKKMLRPREVQEFIAPMDAVARDFTRRLARITRPDHTVPHLEQEIFKWAMESVGTMLFEERIGCFKDPMPEGAAAFIKNLQGFFHTLQPLMYNAPFYKLYEHSKWKQFERYTDNVLEIGLQFVNKKLDAIKRQRLYGVSEGDVEEKSAFLTYLLTQRSLTPQEANLHAVDLLTGAVETTSNATIWCLYCLATNPRAQQALHQEVSRVLGASDVITAEVLNNMPYVKAVLKETFRLFPITFATSRIIAQDIEIGGYHVPKGTHVQANLWGMGHDSSLFEDAESYKPERWLRSEGDRDRDSVLQSLANLPWGHGARMCIGRRVAEQEIYINLIKLIQRFKLEYDGPTIEPVLNTVMTPDRPVPIKFISRT